MLKRIISSFVAILFAAAITPDLAHAQSTIGIGESTYVDQNDAIVLGQADFFPVQPITKLAILSDEFGNVTEAVVDVATDGSFVMFASNQIINGSTSFVDGTFIEPGTGEPSGDFSIVVETEFEKWFEKWRKKLNGITTPPTGRPCLYKYIPHLRDNYEDIEMADGDYFPYWDPDNEATNLDFIREVLKEGKPVRDTYVNEDGTRIDATGTLHDEREILDNGGYDWDSTIPGWKVPAGHVWVPVAPPAEGAPGRWEAPSGGNQ